jgi:Rps23 Pro-64 3,4-dihydroxylase Tpa1-like proline 4-hydroxylase
MSKIVKEELVNLIISKLSPLVNILSKDFQLSGNDVGIRYCAVDDLLPIEMAERISKSFPELNTMRLMNSFREKKLTSKKFDEYDPLLGDVTFAIQDKRVIDLIERITNIKNQVPDPNLYAGGLSAMVKGHFLGPHIDNSHDGSRKYYRTLNLLYYVSPDWCMESGGNLELWDKPVRRNTTIVSCFNRLVIMETTPVSWHSVSPVLTDKVRKCVSNYYFSSESPIGVDYFNVTSFSARPEQPFRRIFAVFDSKLRHLIRKVAHDGFGRKDVYRGPKS